VEWCHLKLIHLEAKHRLIYNYCTSSRVAMGYGDSGAAGMNRGEWEEEPLRMYILDVLKLLSLDL
jgi:hypothetical protein